MKFLSVNYYLNQTYMVEDSALVDLTKEALKNVKTVKADEIKVSINKQGNGFAIDLVVEIKKNASIKDAALKIQEQIEALSLNITASKPENIQITFKEAE